MTMIRCVEGIFTHWWGGMGAAVLVPAVWSPAAKDVVILLQAVSNYLAEFNLFDFIPDLPISSVENWL